MMPAFVDEDVQRPLPVGDECPDRCLIGEVEQCDPDIVSGAIGEVGGGTLARPRIAYGNSHLSAGAGQGAGGLDTDAGGATGDDGPPAGEVDAINDVTGCRFRAERGEAAVLGHDGPGSGMVEAEEPPLLLSA
jgi:hypothetical protein